MDAIFPRHIRSQDFEIGFVNQSGRAQGMIGFFRAHVTGRKRTELRIDDGHQFVARVRAAFPPSLQKNRDFVRAVEAKLESQRVCCNFQVRRGDLRPDPGITLEFMLRSSFLRTPDKPIEQLSSGRIRGLFESDRRYKYLDTLITLFVTILLVSNIIAIKFFAIGSPAHQFGAGAFSAHLHLWRSVHRSYGYSASRRAIWYGFFASFSAGCAQLHRSDHSTGSGIRGSEGLCGQCSPPVGRIVAASLLAYWCGEFANSFTLAKLKLLNGRAISLDAHHRFDNRGAGGRYHGRNVCGVLRHAPSRNYLETHYFRLSD